MKQPVLLDTGPLVALLSTTDAHHAWARQQFARLGPPMLTCEPVVTESCFLVRSSRNGTAAILEMLERGALRIGFRLEGNSDSLSRLMRKYASVPMSLADACLVRMSELNANAAVLTLDSDFAIYRRHGRQPLELIRP